VFHNESNRKTIGESQLEGRNTFEQTIGGRVYSRDAVRTWRRISYRMMKLQIGRSRQMGYDCVWKMDTEGGVEQVGDYEGAGTAP
jgi:hypothetical protein